MWAAVAGGKCYFDDAETVAAESEIVDAVAETTITKIKGLLAVERWAGISIWYSLHIGQYRD